LKSKDASEACYKCVKPQVLKKIFCIYVKQHSKLAQLGVVLENALFIHILQQIKPYANPRTFYIHNMSDQKNETRL